MRLTGNTPTPEEIELLMMADRVYQSTVEKKND